MLIDAYLSLSYPNTGDHSDNEVETITFTISEDRSDNTLSSSSSTTTPTASMMFTPPLPEQVINVSEVDCCNRSCLYFKQLLSESLIRII